MTADPKSVDGRRETARFARWTFDSYRDAATDPNLSANEKIGMPDAFREGYGEAIWNDMRAKLPALAQPGSRVLDIGPGCAEPPRLLIRNAEARGQQVLMVDHGEMLAQLPDSPCLSKLAGRFPETPGPDSDLVREGFDAILVYSVLQTVINEANPFAFVDAAMAMLRPGGRLLIGDIPNVSKLRRFLASDAGQQHHKAYMRTDEPPLVPPFAPPLDRIDDGMVLGLLTRARLAGFDAYLLPQPPELPLANRREDILIVRP
jgi:2-polyprenyl-3-methyl-5-hydroxy-6-metoxy-1,4-benzoquinol methylase